MIGILAAAAGQLAILAGLIITALAFAVVYLVSEVRYQRRQISSLDTAADQWRQAFYELRDQQATAETHWLDELEQHANGGEGR